MHDWTDDAALGLHVGTENLQNHKFQIFVIQLDFNFLYNCAGHMYRQRLRSLALPATVLKCVEVLLETDRCKSGLIVVRLVGMWAGRVCRLVRLIFLSKN